MCNLAEELDKTIAPFDDSTSSDDEQAGFEDMDACDSNTSDAETNEINVNIEESKKNPISNIVKSDVSIPEKKSDGIQKEQRLIKTNGVVVKKQTQSNPELQKVDPKIAPQKKQVRFDDKVVKIDPTKVANIAQTFLEKIKGNVTFPKSTLYFFLIIACIGVLYYIYQSYNRTSQEK